MHETFIVINTKHSKAETKLRVPAVGVLILYGLCHHPCIFVIINV